jgi:hypothetical protein|tara:strand:+ start:1158 stop:2525 length:1368 start_codon:yes stop_codon:yes gene_type:complete
MNLINKIEQKKINIVPYNLTFASKRKIFYPKNYSELKNIFEYLKKKNKKVLIKSGKCGHGDKTNLKSSDLIISLEKINKIISINKKKLILKAQSGANLYSLFKILKKKKLSIYNIPGGKTVSLGGAISGNVHGRPQNKKFSVFGDNVISLKVMLEDGKIINLTKNSKRLKKIIGGLSLFGIILEAKIKLFKISERKFFKKTNLIKNEKEFNNLNKSIDNFYGYINFFKIHKFEGIFFNFDELQKKDNNLLKNDSFLSFQDFLHFFKLTSLISFFINKYTLKIFYYFLFLFYKIKIKENIFKEISYENSVYFINLNKYLPYYFSGGMIEIQFSAPNERFDDLVSRIKNEFYNFNIFPHFFIIKKLAKSKKDYIFNFPKNELSISLCFPKKKYLKEKNFFILLYKILLQYNCNFYVTKDETFLENIKNINFKKKLKRNIFKAEKFISSDFKEKLLKI